MSRRILILIAVLAVPLSLIAGPAMQAAVAQGASTAHRQGRRRAEAVPGIREGRVVGIPSNSAGQVVAEGHVGIYLGDDDLGDGQFLSAAEYGVAVYGISYWSEYVDNYYEGFHTLQRYG